jgi:hypothetical protein
MVLKSFLWVYENTKERMDDGYENRSPGYQ